MKKIKVPAFLTNLSGKAFVLIGAVLAVIVFIVIALLNAKRAPEKAIDPREPVIAISQSIASKPIVGTSTPYFSIAANVPFTYTLKSVSGGCPVRAQYGPGWDNRFWFSSDQEGVMSVDFVGKPNQSIAVAVTLVSGKNLESVTESRVLTIGEKGYRRTKIQVSARKKEVAIW